MMVIRQPSGPSRKPVRIFDISFLIREEKKKMRFKTITLFLSLSLILVAIPLAVDAQKKGAASTGTAKMKMQITKSQSAPAATADPNIKKADATNDKSGAQTPAPPNKGGQKGKGLGPGYVEVTFNNFTPWYVNCFVDGLYRGTVAPWGAMTFATGNGVTTLYARADFVDGTALNWGPWQTVYYSGWRYSWRLDP
jgi:hypothetical protein